MSLITLWCSLVRQVTVKLTWFHFHSWLCSWFSGVTDTYCSCACWCGGRCADGEGWCRLCSEHSLNFVHRPVDRPRFPEEVQFALRLLADGLSVAYAASLLTYVMCWQRAERRARLFRGRETRPTVSSADEVNFIPPLGKRRIFEAQTC